MRDARALRAGVADPDFALDERRERRVDDALVGVLAVAIARSSEKDYHHFCVRFRQGRAVDRTHQGTGVALSRNSVLAGTWRPYAMNYRVEG